MPSSCWPSKYKVVRESTVQFLQENGLANKLISVNHLSVLFNGFAGVGCDPKLAVKFDEGIFSQSFSNASESSSFGMDGSHYAVPLQNFMTLAFGEYTKTMLCVVGLWFIILF